MRTKVKTDMLRRHHDTLLKYSDEWKENIRMFKDSAEKLCDSWSGSACELFKAELPDILERYEQLGRMLKEYADFILKSAEMYEETEADALSKIKHIAD